MLKLWTAPAMEEAIASGDTGAGEQGRCWSSWNLWRSSIEGDLRLPGDYWCICISSGTPIHQPGIQQCTSYPKQLSGENFPATGKLIPCPPASEWDCRVAAALGSQPPTGLPFPCSSTIPHKWFQNTELTANPASRKDSVTQSRLKLSRILIQCICRYQNNVKIKYTCTT